MKKFIDFPGLVLCTVCGSMRSKQLVSECFCGNKSTRPAPPLEDPNEKLQLFKDSELE